MILNYNSDTMRLFKILSIALIVLMFSVGIASAIDISDFHSPKGFDEGFGERMDYEDFSITIEDYDAEFDYKNFFVNDEFHNLTFKGNMVEYVDSFHDSVGTMELIKIGKSNYVVKCNFEGDDTSKISDCTKYLKEFNKKNKLQPEKIEEPDETI